MWQFKEGQFVDDSKRCPKCGTNSASPHDENCIINLGARPKLVESWLAGFGGEGRPLPRHSLTEDDNAFLMGQRLRKKRIRLEQVRVASSERRAWRRRNRKPKQVEAA